MLITGKVNSIIQPDDNRDIYILVLSKKRRNKPIEIAIIFWGKLSDTIKNNFIKIGDKIDIQFYAYSKTYIYKGKQNFNSYLVAESWRPYVKGKERYREVVNQNTGEIIKRKGEL